MKKVVLIASLGLMAIGFNACKKDVALLKNEQDAIYQTDDDVHEKLLALRKPISELLKNDNFRKLLKEEALKQFDGDYDVLFSNVLRFDLNNTFKKSSEDFDFLNVADFFEKRYPELLIFIKENLDLQISIPVNCEEWDTDSFIPSVCTDMHGVDELYLGDEIEVLNLYGEFEFLSLNEDPEDPVVVVGISERVDESGKLLPDFIEDNNKKENDNLNFQSKSGSKDPYLRAVQITNLKAIEPWIKGKPEIYFVIIDYKVLSQIPNTMISTMNSTLSAMQRVGVKYDRKDVKDEKICSLSKYQFSMPTWIIDPNVGSNVNSSDWMIYCYEKDGNRKNKDVKRTHSASVSVNVVEPNTGATVNAQYSLVSEITIQKDRNDDDMGHTTIKYTDARNKRNSVSHMHFWVTWD